MRGRAMRYFKVGAEKRTAARIGVLLYLSLDERLAEIVADEAIHAKVAARSVGRRDGGAGRRGPRRAARRRAWRRRSARIGAIVAEHFPKTDADINELPDRLIEL